MVRGQRGGREPERDSGQLSAPLLGLVASSIPSSSRPVHPRKAIAFSAGAPRPFPPSSLRHLPPSFFSPISELSERGDRATSSYLRVFQSLGARASSAAPFLNSRDPIRYASRTEAGAPSPPGVHRLRVSPWGTAGAPRSAPTARRAAPSPHHQVRLLPAPFSISLLLLLLRITLFYFFNQPWPGFVLILGSFFVLYTVPFDWTLAS